MKKFKNSFNIKLEDKEKYLLPTEEDYEILYKIYELEKKNLSAEDKKLLEFIRTQLEKDWRSPIIKLLGKISKNYK